MIDPAALLRDPNRIVPGCACRLASTMLRIDPRTPPDVLALAERVEDATPYTDPVEFAIHMQLEETWIFPAMTPADRARGLCVHRLLRRGAGVRVFAEHAAWEQRVFPRLGAAPPGA